ncbi:Hydroxypyruvate reductase [Nocardia cerradoensis]|uniref:Hydroxypyruvate reductase n=1 Tax=Nocardia cerradoensis TaxID=85688 RepID=A0A231H9A9_9NOCA|nr:NAD(P)-dependent oxidoreductase [Nocardia cerradoensis]OXR45316.1 Hydroxypyruvate reductase [Nocardia cerradoensis]
MIPAEPGTRPAHPRILVIDPAPGELAIPELEGLAALGLAPTANLRRVADPTLRSEISRRWHSIDLDGFRADDIVAAFDRHGGYDALKCRAGIPLTCDVFERLTASTHDQPLRLVARAASGVDSFDLDAAAERGVTVLSTPGANAGAVAELTIGLMLDALRGISRRDTALRAGDWTAAIGGIPTGSLADARVGLIGSGSIAREVAKRLAPFGAEVWVHGSPRFTARDAQHWPARWTGTLRELMTGCDIISVHVPATAATAGLIGARELRWMRPGSILVNTSRAARGSRRRSRCGTARPGLRSRPRRPRCIRHGGNIFHLSAGIESTHHAQPPCGRNDGAGDESQFRAAAYRDLALLSERSGVHRATGLTAAPGPTTAVGAISSRGRHERRTR